MVHHVEERARDADGLAGADPQKNIANLAHGTVTQKPLEVLLNQHHHAGTNNRDGSNDQQNHVHACGHFEEVQYHARQKIDPQELVERCG